MLQTVPGATGAAVGESCPEYSGVALNSWAMQVGRNGIWVDLGSVSYQFFDALFTRATQQRSLPCFERRGMTTDEIVKSLNKGRGAVMQDATLRGHVAELNKKLKPLKLSLKNRRPKGYMLVDLDCTCAA